jgi:GNAT superfamily N-acetyltransferase
MEIENIMSTEYRIIEANLNDQEKIILLVNEAYWRQQQPFFLDIPVSRERLNSIQLSQLMRDKTQKIFLLMENHHILGVIAIEIPKDEDYAKFTLFALHEKHRGKKFGRLLIGHAENYALERGRRIMKIEVFTFAARLSEYYARLGYAMSGKAVSFFHEECIRPEYQNSCKLYLNEMIKDLKKNGIQQGENHVM